VGLVAPYFSPHVGGVESHVESVATELARRGRAVTVLTSRLAGTAPRERRDGFDVVRLPMRANVWTTPVLAGVGEALASGGFDVVHTHSPPPVTAWQASRATRRLGLPHVLTHHCDLEINAFYGPLVVEVFRRTLGRSTVALADAVVATTRTYAATSRSLWRHPDVEVVPNPVDPERFRPGLDGRGPRERHGLGDRRVALFVGRLTHHKGVDTFVRAAAHTPADVAHVVVGDGPERARLERLARDAPGKVVFAGRIRHDDLPSYYAAADVGVLPSTSRLEAFGIAALEAQACGKPVVVSRIPGVHEVVEDGVTGLLAEPLDARDLGRAITDLVSDRERARAIGEAARARILANFTIGAVVDGLEAVYARVLKARGA